MAVDTIPADQLFGNDQEKPFRRPRRRGHRFEPLALLHCLSLLCVELKEEAIVVFFGARANIGIHSYDRNLMDLLRNIMPAIVLAM